MSPIIDVAGSVIWCDVFFLFSFYLLIEISLLSQVIFMVGSEQKVQIHIHSQERHPKISFLLDIHLKAILIAPGSCCNFMRLFGLNSRGPGGCTLQQPNFFHWATESKCLQPSLDPRWRSFIYYTGQFGCFNSLKTLLSVLDVTDDYYVFLIIVWGWCMSLWCNSWT